MKWLRGGAHPVAESAPLSEIRQTFEQSAADEEHFPSSIDPKILHVRVVLEEMAGASRVLDAGCGKGRFARLLKERSPERQIVAFDLAESMLHNAPASLDRCAGTLTRLPFADSSFDGAYATESLEHAVDIDAAVAELCRVVRPAGKIVVIDKNADHWGRFDTPRWERWFTAKEMIAMLGKHCHEVSCAPISYWEDVPPDGLFLCWKATR